MSDVKYKAFISYSHVDENWATWLHRALENYRIPKRLVSDAKLESNRLVPVFRDRDELASANDLSLMIQTALRESQALIVICSRSAASSPWVNREIEYFQELGRADKVFTLVIDDPAESFPPATTANLNGTVQEPLAADARPEGDGKKRALLKIVSALVGVGLDELVNRDSQRKLRQVSAFAIAASAALIMTIGLAVITLIAQREAETEAARAGAFNKFMQDTVLSPDPEGLLGREVTVAESLISAVEKIEDYSGGQPEVAASLQYAIGWAFIKLGRYDDAEPLVKASLETREQILGQHELATTESQLRVAEIMFKRGDNIAARELFNRALENRRAILPPGDIRLAETLDHLSEVLIVLGRYEDAKRLLLEVIEIANQAGRRKYIAGAKNKLGIVAWNEGEYESAKTFYEDTLFIERSEYGETHPLVAGTLNNLAIVLYSTGELEKAETAFREIVDIQRAAYGDQHEEVATALGNLAAVVNKRGKLIEAEALFRETLAIDKAQLGNDHPNVGIDMANLGALLLELGRIEEACATLEESYNRLSSSLDEGHWRIASAQLEFGSCLGELGEYRRAEVHVENAIAVIETHFGAESDRAEEARNRLLNVKRASR